MPVRVRSVLKALGTIDNPAPDPREGQTRERGVEPILLDRSALSLVGSSNTSDSLALLPHAKDKINKNMRIGRTGSERRGRTTATSRNLGQTELQVTP